MVGWRFEKNVGWKAWNNSYADTGLKISVVPMQATPEGLRVESGAGHSCLWMVDFAQCPAVTLNTLMCLSAHAGGHSPATCSGNPWPAAPPTSTVLEVPSRETTAPGALMGHQHLKSVLWCPSSPWKWSILLIQFLPLGFKVGSSFQYLTFLVESRTLIQFSFTMTVCMCQTPC